MSRLALPSAKKTGSYTLLGLKTASQQPNGGSAPPSAGRSGAAAATATCSVSPSDSSGWDTDEDEQPLNRSSKKFYAGSAQRAVAGAKQPHSAAVAPAVPAQPQQQHQRQPQPASALLFATPRSEVYDVRSSSSESDRDSEGDGNGAGGGSAPQAAAEAPATTNGAGPAAQRAQASIQPSLGRHSREAACPDRLTCGGSLPGLPLGQQQLHINACCQAAAIGSDSGAPWTGAQLPLRATDTIPAYRPCPQQQQRDVQQQDMQQQQQQHDVQQQQRQRQQRQHDVQQQQRHMQLQQHHMQQQHPPPKSDQSQQAQQGAATRQHAQQQDARKLAAKHRWGRPAASALLAQTGQPQQQQQSDQQAIQQPHLAQQQEAQQEQATVQQRCKVCGTDLSHLHYLQQVSHVKACMAGRGTKHTANQQQQPQEKPQQRKRQLPLPQQPPPQQQQDAGPGRGAWPQAVMQPEPANGQAVAAGVPPSVVTTSSNIRPSMCASGKVEAAASSPREMSIGQWLESLGLGCYTSVFECEEVDVRVVHLVTTDELAGLGVTDRRHQVRIMQAAQEMAAALGLRRPKAAGRATAAAGSKEGVGPAAAKKQRQPTELLSSGGVDSRAAAPAAASGQQGPQQPQRPAGSWQQQEQLLPREVVQEGDAGSNRLRDTGPRLHERALLASLYPPRPLKQAVELSAAPAVAGGATTGGVPPLQPRRTPLLPAGRTASRATPASASLWAGAGACSAVAPTLAARLAQREAEATANGTAVPQQPLARGGTAYPAAQESRALKRMKLEALRQELAHHEATVNELKGMIEQLQREVDGDWIQPCDQGPANWGRTTLTLC